MDAPDIAYPEFPPVSGVVTSPPEVQCNLTIHFRCHDGFCVNATVLCDGYIDCTDGSDEEGCFEPMKRTLSPLEVAAIVLGCIIGTVIVCCLLGTIIDCFMHVYKYWCSCLHKAYQCPSEMIALKTQNNPSDPTVLVVRAIPPSYSTILVSCEPTSVVSRSRDSSSDEATSPNTASTIITTADLIPSPKRDSAADDADTAPQDADVGNNRNNNNTTKEISTQTSSDSGVSLFSNSSSSAAQSITNLLGVSSRSTSCLSRLRLPPSYSSIFTGDATTATPSDPLSVFQQHAAARRLANHHVQVANVEVHSQRSPPDDPPCTA